MKKSVFGGDIKAMRERVKTLARRAGALPVEHKVFFREALKDLSSALEALEVAGGQSPRRESEGSSFPDLNPNPVIEVDSTGRITYLNAAAKDLFPGLEKAGGRHPWLSGLEKAAGAVERGSGRFTVREVKVGGKCYEQFISSVAESGRVRVYGHDISGWKRADEALEAARSEAVNEKNRLVAVFEALPVGLAILDAKGGNIRSNGMFEAVWGGPRPPARDVGDYALYRAWWADTGKPVRPEEWASARAVQKGEAVLGQLLRIERFDGIRRVVLNSAAPIRNAEGGVTGSVVAILDVTDLKRAEDALLRNEAQLHRLNRTLKALSSSNQAMMRAVDEAGYLRDVCNVIVEDCGHAMVWIGYAEEDAEKSVRPVAHAGFEEGYLETLKLTWADTERGRGPTGTAIRTGKPATCSNVLTDPKFAPWREEASLRGYASSIVLPLVAGGKAFGAVNIYSKEADPFSEDEEKLLAELADDLAYGIGVLRARAAREKAEQALRESEEGYRSLFNRMTEGFALHEVICDEKGEPCDYRFLDINPAFERLTGLARKEVVGRTKNEVLPEDDLFWVKTYGAVALSGEPIHFERFSAPLGKYYEVFAYSPQPRRFAVVFLDTTERRRMEEALRRSHAELEKRVQERTAELAQANELLERVFSSIDFSIAYMDKEFNFIRVNRAYAAAHGRTTDFFTGKNHFALFPDERIEAIFKRVAQTGEPHFELEKPFIGATDSDPKQPGNLRETYWDWSLQPVKEPGGETGGVVLSLVNVTGRRTAEEERLRLATAVEQSDESVVITDGDDNVIYVNRAFETLHALARNEALGRKYHREILEIDREDASYRKSMRETLGRGDAWNVRLSRKMRDGGGRELDVTIFPVRDPSGAVINYAALEHDRTEETRLQEHVRQLQKMDALGTLAGGIAHDFNNILVPILVNTEMALFDAAEGSPLARYLTLAFDAANRGKELVKQIITFSRQKEQSRVPVEIVPIIKEGLKFLRASIPKTIEIREHIEAESGVVRADPTQMHQVLMNLGTNAAHAMRERGGTMEVRISELEVDAETAARNPDLRPGPCLRLTVADTGHGMTRDVMGKAFDPFFTTKKPGEGTGMGLSVVLGIVKSHGGAVTVRSEPGKGTTFDVFFPRVVGGDRKTGTVSTKTIFPGSGRILFIDDEEILVETARPMLERLGYRVTATTDAIEALEQFRAQPHAFDLVITDQTMPQLSGEKLAVELLRIRPDLPVILCTGYSEMIREEDSRALGIRDFIMKPFSIGEIAERIHNALKKE
jgi:PAS domain S-box-containing protein